MNTKIAETIIKSQKECPDLLKMTIPILIESTLHMMLGFVDVFMLGRYSDLAASGVNAANQVITVLSMVFLVFSSSGGILISFNFPVLHKKIDRLYMISVKKERRTLKNTLI